MEPSGERGRPRGGTARGAADGRTNFGGIFGCPKKVTLRVFLVVDKDREEIEIEICHDTLSSVLSIGGPSGT